MRHAMASRRQILRASGVLVTAGVAGCLSEDGGESQSPATDENDSETEGEPGSSDQETDDTSSSPVVLAPDDGERGDEFGAAVALNGDAVMVGAPGDRDSAGYRVGATYAFERVDDGWTRPAPIGPDNDGDDLEFGAAVALDADAGLVGAPLVTADGRFEAGVACVLDRLDDGWNRGAAMLPDSVESGALFGAAVALSGDTALVGAPGAGAGTGAAYAFERSGGDWRLQSALVPSGAGRGDELGTAVALDGDAALVGAPGDGNGAVHAFERADDGWRHRSKLTTDNGDSGDRFGAAVAIAGDEALVGHPRVGPNGQGAGTASAFTRSDGDWRRRETLVPENDDGSGKFGAAVAVAGDAALIGAPGGDAEGAGSGTAHAYRRSEDGWDLLSTFGRDDGERQDRFGAAVAIGGGTALVGAPDDGPGTASVFDL